MRRADRLFQIIQLLRGRTRTMTAARLAERLEVSERTIYRDIRDLMASGTPIEGEAGVGYTLRRDYDLPPLMFEVDELEAIVVGARLLHAFGDQAMARAAASAISKVEAVIPARVREISEKPLSMLRERPVGRTRRRPSNWCGRLCLRSGSSTSPTRMQTVAARSGWSGRSAPSFGV